MRATLIYEMANTAVHQVYMLMHWLKSIHTYTIKSSMVQLIQETARKIKFTCMLFLTKLKRSLNILQDAVRI